MTYDRLQDVPEGHLEAIREGVLMLGRNLRRWRRDYGLHAMSAQWMTADSPITIHCDHNDRITMRIAGETIDATSLFEADGQSGQDLG